MKRTAQWERMADRWRIQLPLPRYLRHSPLRAMRERMWFVSRLQPKIDVTVNLANTVRIQTLAPAPSTVFLHRWLTERTGAPEAAPPEAPASMPRLGLPLTRMSPLARVRKEQRPASSAGPVAKPVPASQAVAEGSARLVPALITRLAGRARRMNDMTPGPGARVLKRGSAAAVAESVSSSRQAPEWGEARRGFPRLEPGFAPGPAALLPAAVNVEQLTDQVLRQLDRRLIASRERLGRI